MQKHKTNLNQVTRGEDRLDKPELPPVKQRERSPKANKTSFVAIPLNDAAKHNNNPGTLRKNKEVLEISSILESEQRLARKPIKNTNEDLLQLGV